MIFLVFSIPKLGKFISLKLLKLYTLWEIIIRYFCEQQKQQRQWLFRSCWNQRKTEAILLSFHPKDVLFSHKTGTNLHLRKCYTVFTVCFPSPRPSWERGAPKCAQYHYARVKWSPGEPVCAGKPFKTLSGGFTGTWFRDYPRKSHRLKTSLSNKWNLTQTQVVHQSFSGYTLLVLPVMWYQWNNDGRGSSKSSPEESIDQFISWIMFVNNFCVLRLKFIIRVLGEISGHIESKATWPNL